MIRIGTSGYNHRDWIGSFYPTGMGPARYLARYAEEFDLCELNTAVHRVPGPEEAARILDESEGRLLFTVLAPRCLVTAVSAAANEGGPSTDAPAKARGSAMLGDGPYPVEGRCEGPFSVGERRDGFPVEGRNKAFPAVGAGFLTSEGGSDEIPGRDFAQTPPGSEASVTRRPSGSSDDGAARAGPAMDRLLARLREGLLPYARARRFGGLVLPLPAGAPATEEALAVLARCRDRLEDLPLLVEPRDGSWTDGEVQGVLRSLRAGFVLADGPDPAGPSFGPDRGGARPLPARRTSPFAPATAETACVRFHGRDGETRWAGGAARRDYLYSWEELVGWLPALRALAARARDLFVVFNNPWRGRAVENARMLRRLIGPATREETSASSPEIPGVDGGLSGAREC